MGIDYNLIGERIKEARKNKGYTQERLAEEIDMFGSEAADKRILLDSISDSKVGIVLIQNDSSPFSFVVARPANLAISVISCGNPPLCSYPVIS